MASRTLFGSSLGRATQVAASSSSRGRIVATFPRLASSTSRAQQEASAPFGQPSGASSYSAAAATSSVTSFSSSPSEPAASDLPSPLEPAKVLPRTHNHHVATLQLRCFGHGQPLQNLEFFTDFAVRAGYALGIPLSKPASLPTRISLWTVLRGPFVHKKSQENFERRTYKRVIKVWDADVEVVEKWLHFLRIHGMAGVGMRAEVFRSVPLSFGAQMLAASTAQLRSVPDGDEGQTTDATLRASEMDAGKISHLAEGIIREEMAQQTDEGVGEEPAIEASSEDGVTESRLEDASSGANEAEADNNAPEPGSEVESEKQS